MTPAEIAEWDAYLERTQPSWDEAFDAARYDDDVFDTPASVLVFAPFAPHIDRLPRDPEAAAWLLHELEASR
jgi:hypothetical protein